MEFASRSGNFSKYEGALINDDMTLAPVFEPTALRLVAALPGDGDLNGIVNFADFAALSNNFGGVGTEWVQGNYNLDHITNFQDFAILSNNFGRSIPPSPPVPEPSAFAALLTAIALGRTRKIPISMGTVR